MTPDDALLLKRHAPGARIEIARSFSFKLNTGNYCSVDFFQSAKKECDEEDAADTAEKLYQFCKSQVLKAVHEYQEELERKRPVEIPQRKATR